MSRNPRLRLWLEVMEDRHLLSGGFDFGGVEWRTIDGTNNNLALPTQGAAQTEQIRFGYGAQFPDSFGDSIITDTTFPRSRLSARSISNAIHDQPASVLNGRHLTDWAFQWGQWITHDMDLTLNGPEFNVLSTGAVGNFSIPVTDPNDPFGTTPIPFNRSEFVDGTGVPGNRREVVNSITSYIDASMVYGSDAVRAAALRTFQGGKLKTSANGQLLPYWNPASGLPNADPLGLGGQLFLAGDVRANEQLNLTAVHTMFVREHNRLATRIHKLYPQLNDEKIYQLARRIVGAEMQIITYEEYLPAIMGYDIAPDPDDAVYDAAVNAAVTNSFAHAAFRFGHSQINEATLLVTSTNQVVGSLSVDDAFFNPQFLKTDPSRIGKMLKGLASQLGQENDLLLVDGVRNNLFGPPGAGGLDLAALDIQRGRDHGLPDFNTLRRLYGVGPALTTFDQISSDPALVAKLQALYPDVLNPDGSVAVRGIDNIDPFVGMLAEDHLPGTSVGATVFAIVGNQFARLRDGDRFFYANDPVLDSQGVRAIIDLDNVTLAQIIRWNTGMTIQDNVFFDRSVMIFEAPDSGSNLTLVADRGDVSLVNTRTGQTLTRRSLADVTQVILVGSDTARDFFNLFIASANRGLEDGVVVYGGDSTGDVLNVYGTPNRDTFVASNSTFSTGAADPLGNDVVVTVPGAKVAINGNKVYSSGIETIRLVKRGSNDQIQVDPSLSNVFALFQWDTRNET